MHIEKIEEIVRDVLGIARARSTDGYLAVNHDGNKILRVLVVYDAAKPITVDEMDSIVDRAWDSLAEKAGVVPVFDFRADSGNDFLAAE